jgi:hypothetical protein
LKIESVFINNIKRFDSKGIVCNFKGSSPLITISGKNGSGKTAIFKSLQVFQKIFFYDQLSDVVKSKYHNYILASIQAISSSGDSAIEVEFSIDNESYNVRVLLTLDVDYFSYEIEDGQFGEGITTSSVDKLKENWNLESPQNLISFIDAGKSFSDFGVSFENISIDSRAKKEDQFILDCIFKPEEVFQAIYKRTVLDHVHYRLDPSRKYAYFRAANEAVRLISGNIEVKNISATRKDNHLIMVGKTSEKSQLFDVKDFSAGERALYLTILFLFYLPKVGILIIDEPENHFHENLLLNFYDFLKNSVSSGGVYEWLKNTSSSTLDDGEFLISKLNQIFMITHSKPLIYRNIDFGDCYIVKKESVDKIINSEIIKELRIAGISSVFSKTVFVEGQGDVELLSKPLNISGIKLHPLGSCKEVIEHFKKISSIKHDLHEAAFCFLIDRDNKSDQEIEQIRLIDEVLFDSSFIVMEHHEVENYFIDVPLILDSVNPALEALRANTLSSESINELFLDTSKRLKDQSEVKFIASEIKSKIKEEISDYYSNSAKLKDAIKNGSERIVQHDINSMIDGYFLLAKEQFEKKWTDNWKTLVDGKAFYNIIMSSLPKKCAGINSEIIKSKMFSVLDDQPDKYELGKLINCILEKIKLQNYEE